MPWNRGQSSRVAYARVEGTLNPGGTLSGCDGHGALNAHIVGNYDDFTGSQHQDSEGYSYGVGVCPFVKMGSSVIFDNSVLDQDFTSPDYPTMASDAYADGARVSNNSWGADVGGRYDIDAQTYDALVRDAQSGVNGNQEMTFAFAAGNAGPCNSKEHHCGELIRQGSLAKNVITVGASVEKCSLAFRMLPTAATPPMGTDTCGQTGRQCETAPMMLTVVPAVARVLMGE